MSQSKKASVPRRASRKVLLARIYTWGSDVAPAPLKGEVANWGYEEVRGCADVLVGRLGMWR